MGNQRIALRPLNRKKNDVPNAGGRRRIERRKDGGSDARDRRRANQEQSVDAAKRLLVRLRRFEVQSYGRDAGHIVLQGRGDARRAALPYPSLR